VSNFTVTKDKGKVSFFVSALL